MDSHDREAELERRVEELQGMVRGEGRLSAKRKTKFIELFLEKVKRSLRMSDEAWAEAEARLQERLEAAVDFPLDVIRDSVQMEMQDEYGEMLLDVEDRYANHKQARLATDQRTAELDEEEAVEEAEDAVEQMRRAERAVELAEGMKLNEELECEENQLQAQLNALSLEVGRALTNEEHLAKKEAAIEANIKKVVLKIASEKKAMADAKSREASVGEVLRQILLQRLATVQEQLDALEEEARRRMNAACACNNYLLLNEVASPGDPEVVAIAEYIDRLRQVLDDLAIHVQTRQSLFSFFANERGSSAQQLEDCETNLDHLCNKVDAIQFTPSKLVHRLLCSNRENANAYCHEVDEQTDRQTHSQSQTPVDADALLEQVLEESLARDTPMDNTRMEMQTQTDPEQTDVRQRTAAMMEPSCSLYTDSSNIQPFTFTSSRDEDEIPSSSQTDNLQREERKARQPKAKPQPRMIFSPPRNPSKKKSKAPVKRCNVTDEDPSNVQGPSHAYMPGSVSPAGPSVSPSLRPDSCDREVDDVLSNC